MALVAMLGMVTAYRTATAEEEASLKESELTQARFLEFTKREELLDRTSGRAHFEMAKEGHLQRAEECRVRAGKIRASDRGRAVLLELEAQEEYSLALVQEPYLAFTEVPGMSDNSLSMQKIIDRQVARDLSNSGRGSKWADKGKTIWENLETQIGNSRKKLKRLALAVIIFVVSLGCLSLAELWRNKRTLMLMTMALGVLVCLTGLFFAILVDHASLWYYTVCAMGFALLAPATRKIRPRLQKLSKLLATKLGFMTTAQAKEAEERESLHPPETDVRLFVGARMHAERVKSPFTCLVVLLIVLAVLLSAWVSYSYSDASIQASASAGNATENITNGLKNSHTTSAYFALNMLAALQERRARYKAALQKNELAKESALGIDQRSVDETLYHATEQIHPKNDDDKDLIETLDGTKGTEYDRNFPRKWVLNLTTFGPECGFALADAANEQSLGWRNKAHWFLASITMFAIALYLFGQSLSMGRSEEAWMLVFFGLIVVGVGLGVAGTEFIRRVPNTAYDVEACDAKNAKSDDPALRAAIQYAWGVTDYQIRDYESAVKELEVAVAARPKFLFANLYLSQAAKELGNPQMNEGFLNMIPEERISEAVNREKTALEGFKKNGLEESPLLLGNYGFDTYLYGLIMKDRKLLQRGLDSTEEAIRHDESRQYMYLRYNVAVAQLALGNLDGGLATFADAVKQEGVKGDGDLLAGAVGDLETLYHYCEGLNSKAYCEKIRAKEADITLELARAAWPPPSNAVQDAKSAPALRNLAIQISPSGVRWEAEPINFKIDGGDTTLAVVWYTREPGSQVWRVLAKVSGAVSPKSVMQGDDGKIYQFQSYLEATDQESCLPAGDYRADFYLNGVAFPVPSKQLDAPSAMRASPFKDLNLSLCRPSTWRRWRPTSIDDPALTGGYVDNKDHPVQVIFVFDYYYPAAMWDATKARALLARARAYLAAQRMMTPAEFTDEPNTCTVYPKEQFVIRQASRSTGETLVARIWPAKEGVVHLVLAYNHSPQGAPISDSADPLGNEGLECNSLRSVREIYAESR